LGADYSGEYYVGVFIDDEFEVSETNEDDNAVYFTPTISVYVGIEDEPNVYLNCLNQNYPNPITDMTSITYSIKNSSNVVLNIYNINGKLVQTIVNESKLPSSYTVKWNASNLPAGIYVYQLKTNEYSDMKRCVVVK